MSKGIDFFNGTVGVQGKIFKNHFRPPRPSGTPPRRGIYTHRFFQNPKSEIKFSKRYNIPEWGNKITKKRSMICPLIFFISKKCI